MSLEDLRLLQTITDRLVAAVPAGATFRVGRFHFREEPEGEERETSTTQPPPPANEDLTDG